MRKKLVRLGMIFLLVIFMHVEFVYGSGLGFNVSDYFCGTDFTGTYSGTDAQFRTDFFGKFAGPGFNNGPLPYSYIESKSTSPEVRVETSFSRTDNVACAGGNLDDGDEIGVFAYGYLYTLDPLYSTNFMVGSHSSQNENWYTSGRFMILDIRDYYTNTLPLKTYLKNKTPLAYCPYLSVLDDDKRDTGDRDNVWSYGTSLCEYPTAITTGLYFVGIGLVGHSTGRVAAAITLGEGIGIADFNDEGDTAMYTGTLNRVDAIAGKPRYLISDNPLTAFELNTYFKGYVENTSWLCNAAGGYQISVPSIDITNSGDVAKLTAAGMNPSNLCCGDDPDELNSVPSPTGSFEYDKVTYSCSNGKWTDSTSASTCKTLVSDNGGGTGNNVYESIMNTKPYAFYEIKDGAIDGTDGCCGDDTLGDYGFIGPKTPGPGSIFQYFCYANTSMTNFQWLNAINNAYQIKTLNKTGKDVDVISNSEEWFYCNATGTAKMDGGIEIKENRTFANRFSDGSYSCASWYTSYFYGYTDSFTETCDFSSGGATENCCDVDTSGNVRVGKNIGECINTCYLKGGLDNQYIFSIQDTLQALAASGGNTPPPAATTDIDMDVCAGDTFACLGGDYRPNPGISCDAQLSSIKHFLCNSTSFCKGGVFRDTTESAVDADKKCCFGESASCQPLATVNNADSCLSNNGKLFLPAPDAQCDVNPVTLPSNTGLSCCLGSLGVSQNYVSQSAISNTSVICFKEQNNNVLSQCCYDNSCTNKNYYGSNGGAISFYGRRVLTKGASIHTLTNFDVFDDTTNNAVIRNLGRKITSTGTVPFTFSRSETQHFPIFDGFTYLEFDLLTDADDLSVSLNNVYIGDIASYSNNGGSAMVIHHIVIPITTFSTTDTLSRLDFSSVHYANAPITVVLDNIILVPTTYNINTQTYYCTGGFEGWVNDLDAPPGATQYSQIGPYMLACTGIKSYGWTGTQCCGDDTKPRSTANFPLGEFFSDTIAGCFAGSKISNNQTVAESKGIIEKTNLAADQLKTYEYSDLLYYNDSFKGCQVPVNKYSNLHISYNNTNPTSIPLLTSDNIVTTQCAVLGTHYCVSGIWRNRISTYGDPNGETLTNQQISLKPVPPGAELLSNGFNGN